MSDPKDPLNPRKSARQLRSQLTLEAVFEAANQMMEKAGDEMTTHQLAERAGVSVGSLYQYFPSKDSLFRWVLQRHLEKQVNKLREWTTQVKGVPAEEAAHLLIAAMVGDKLPVLKVERALLRYFCKVGDLETLTENDAEMVGIVKEYLDSLGGQARPVNTEVAAFIITNALRSSLLLAILQKPEMVVTPEFREELAQLVIRYMKA